MWQVKNTTVGLHSGSWRRYLELGTWNLELGNYRSLLNDNSRISYNLFVIPANLSGSSVTYEP